MGFNKRMIDRERILGFIINDSFDSFDDFLRKSDAYIITDSFSQIFKTIYDELDEIERKCLVRMYSEYDQFSIDLSKLISTISHPNNSRKHKISILNYVSLFKDKWRGDFLKNKVIEKIYNYGRY